MDVIYCCFSNIYYTKKKEEVLSLKNRKELNHCYSEIHRKEIRMDMDHSDREKAGIEIKRYGKKKKIPRSRAPLFFSIGNKSFGIG